ncbi:hypothetical protein LINGRAHAP2_LOCUS20331 [Linum grandiflorum]
MDLSNLFNQAQSLSLGGPIPTLHLDPISNVGDSLLVLKKWDDALSLEEVSFETADLWVHIYNLAMEYKTQKNVNVVTTTLFCLMLEVEKTGVMKGIWTLL